MLSEKSNTNDEKLKQIFSKIKQELNFAQSKFPKYNSAHEGYAVILEEMDELWDEVKLKPCDRRYERMTLEAVQIATTAIRFILDVSSEGERLYDK